MAFVSKEFSEREEKQPGKIALWLTQQRLTSIYNSLSKLDLNPLSEPTNSCEGFTQFTHSKKYRQLGAVALMNGAAIVFTTKGKFADRSHKLKLPDRREDISYHAIDLDSQSLDTNPVDLYGIGELTGSKEASRQLKFVARYLRHASYDNMLEEATQLSTPYQHLAFMSE